MNKENKKCSKHGVIHKNGRYPSCAFPCGVETPILPGYKTGNTTGIGTSNHLRDCKIKNRPEHDVKSFIRTEKERSRKEAIEEIMGIVERMKLPFKHVECEEGVKDMCEDCLLRFNYSRALINLLSKLKEKLSNNKQ